MTDSTATKAASTNGGTTEKHIPAQREHGVDRLREEECYYVTGLIRECLNEAEHLIREVHNKAFNRTTDHDGTKGTKPLDRAEAKAILDEAYECASLALTYVFSVSMHLRDESDAPPF